MKMVLFGSVCAIALAAQPALAQDWAADAGADYGNLAGSTYWDVNGAAMIPLNWDDTGIEPAFGYGGASVAHDLDAGGSFVWNGGSDFRLAASAIYNHFSLGKGHLDEAQLGVGGEWYPTPWLTLGAEGGGLVGDGSGGYAGGTVKGYVMPDASITGNVTYLDLSKSGVSAHETDYGAKAEWLVSEEFPLSVTAGYEHSQINLFGLSGSTDWWTVGLKFYVNEVGVAPLVDRNRTGTLDTIGPVQLHF